MRQVNRIVFINKTENNHGLELSEESKNCAGCTPKSEQKGCEYHDRRQRGKCKLREERDVCQYRYFAFAVWIDVLKCYKKLGYEIDPSKGECIALSVFVAELYLPDALMLEMSEDKMVEVLPATKRLVSMTEELYPFTEPDDELLFVKVLRADGVDEAIVNKYMALLHQFVSVVVKADGRVDEQEKTWLKQLKTFTPLENRVVLKGPVTR